MKSADQIADTYSDAETVARMQAALKRALTTPHKPHSASKGKWGESREKRAGGTVGLGG